jgi:ABC-type Mn2+/Zn2+ transport system permease subunit
VFEVFDPPYMQRALLAGLLLAIPLGLVGTWVVLRGLAFYSHAAGVATFPGVVVGLGVPALGPFAGSLLATGGIAAVVSALEDDERLRGGAITGIALAAALAAGVALVPVFEIAAPVERALFGSLLAITENDLLRCGAVLAISVAALPLLTARLSTSTFDPAWAGAAGASPRRAEAALLVLVALCVVAALPAVGSLLVSGLLVLPAATARLLTRSVPSLLAASVALAAAETTIGLALAREIDVPPGAAIATIGGGAFAAVAIGTALVRVRHTRRGRA